MTKYSNELRMEIILEVESGASVRRTARKHGVSERMVRRWRANYCKSGIHSLIGENQEYSAEFKRYALEYRKAHALSYPQAAAQLGILHDSTLYGWEKTYLKYGVEALQDTKKGRPPKVPKQPTPSKKPLSQEEQLKERIQQLEMENAYLKKLNALVAEREQSKKKTK